MRAGHSVENSADVLAAMRVERKGQERVAKMAVLMVGMKAA